MQCLRGVTASGAGAFLPSVPGCVNDRSIFGLSALRRDHRAIRAGDAIMIKGSLGSKMKTIVNALEKRFPGSARNEVAG